MVIGCTIYVCSPFCCNCRAGSASQICRHGFYHVATFYDDEDNEVSRRRNGKALRGTIFIYRVTCWGMAGRILTYQVHPGESLTNYAMLVAMRCNVDVQDWRRVLPPYMWTPEEQLDCEGVEAEGKSHNHGRFRQRYSAFSLGEQSHWG